MAPGNGTAAADAGSTNIPKFVYVNCGLETEGEGEGQKLKVGDDGLPIEKRKLFYVQRTGDALKKIIERSESERSKMEARLAADAEMTDEEKTKAYVDVANENIDFLYEGLALILRDPETMEAATAEWLSSHLDYEIAQEWMEIFVPSMGSGSGNSVRGGSGFATARSTDTSTPEPEQPGTEESTHGPSTPLTGTSQEI